MLLLGGFGLLLLVVLVYLGLKNFTNFRATIENKEWVLAPATHIDQVTQVAALLQDRVARLTTEVMALAASLEERREHLQLLTASIAERDAQLRLANLGVEYHARQKSLKSLAQIAEILEIDTRSGVEATKTVGGIKTEIEQLLEELGVITYEPKVGEKLPQRGVSLKQVKTAPAPSPEKVGTVKSVESPAYLYVGANEQEVVLQPMSVTVYANQSEPKKEQQP